MSRMVAQENGPRVDQDFLLGFAYAARALQGRHHWGNPLALRQWTRTSLRRGYLSGILSAHGLV